MMDESMEIVVMLCDANGLLVRELATVALALDRYLLNITAQEDGENYTVRAVVTTERDAEDWEFDAIYDYYDEEVYAETDAACVEVEDCENPSWALSFPWDGDENALEQMLNSLLTLHDAELASVYAEIALHKDEYTE